MAFKMKANPGGPMRKNFPSAFKQDKKSEKTLTRENAERNKKSLKKEGLTKGSGTLVGSVRNRLRNNPSLINDAYKGGPGSHEPSKSEVNDYITKTASKHAVKGTTKNTTGVLRGSKKK